jgi:hypothetical protein
MEVGLSGISSTEDQALLIVLVAQRGSLDLAFAVFSWLEQHQAPPDFPHVTAFNGLLAACANAYAWERALQVRKNKIKWLERECVGTGTTGLKIE